jgi:glycine betaine/proline transport system ATP-binding protein
MQDELITLRTKMNKTIIFITHDFAEALRLGDHIAIMKDGQFMQVGTAAELVTHPANDYVRAFTKDAPRAKILTAANLMRPVSAGAESSASVPTETKLEELIRLVAATDVPVAVVDANRRVVGQVDRELVMRALVE